MMGLRYLDMYLVAATYLSVFWGMQQILWIIIRVAESVDESGVHACTQQTRPHSIRYPNDSEVMQLTSRSPCSR